MTRIFFLVFFLLSQAFCYAQSYIVLPESLDTVEVVSPITWYIECFYGAYNRPPQTKEELHDFVQPILYSSISPSLSKREIKYIKSFGTRKKDRLWNSYDSVFYYDSRNDWTFIVYGCPFEWQFSDRLTFNQVVPDSCFDKEGNFLYSDLSIVGEDEVSGYNVPIWIRTTDSKGGMERWSVLRIPVSYSLREGLVVLEDVNSGIDFYIKDSSAYVRPPIGILELCEKYLVKVADSLHSYLVSHPNVGKVNMYLPMRTSVDGVNRVY